MGLDKYRLTQPPRHDFRAADLGLTPPAKPEPGAWFLGPNGENVDAMRTLMVEALEANAKARHDFWPDDPTFIDKTGDDSPEFKETYQSMRANLDKLSKALRSSTPMASYRNKSHMNWDMTMPGVLGYVAAMLYNPNNVAAEASPVTTSLELEVGLSLCDMLGFDRNGTPRPWGHITCDGSVANYEAMWAARNLRHQGAALARAIRLEGYMAAARQVSVTTAQGDYARLLDLEPWELVNLPNAELLALPERLHVDWGVPELDVKRALDSYSLQAMGLVDFQKDVLQGLHPGVVIVPATAHYSWDKSVALLGLGKHSLRHAAVDVDARGSVHAVRNILEECIATKTPVLQVVAVTGSTAESAVDHIDALAGMRPEYAAKGLSYALHADAAWGGYFASMLRNPKGDAMTPVEDLSPHVHTQLSALGECDSITIDPHKSGYLPYPAGALCYRDERMIYLIAHESPVVFHEGDVPAVGVYGIEGSKPGAAAAGAALSHTTIPLDKSGYGFLLGRCIWNAKRFYIGVNTLNKPEDPFFAVPLKRLPAEEDGLGPDAINAQRESLRPLRDIPNEAVVAILEGDTDLKQTFTRLGPDLTVFAYAFNFMDGDGKPNTDLARMNHLNLEIFKALSTEVVRVQDQPPDIPMLVTSSALPPESYGKDFIEAWRVRAGLDEITQAPRVLISTMQDPWVTDTTDGNFLRHLFPILRDTVLSARQTVLNSKD